MTGEAHMTEGEERLLSALDRTEQNLLRAIRRHPVRDMCENLAENESARKFVENSRKINDEMPPTSYY